MAVKKCIEECPARALQAEGEEKTVQGVLDVVLQDKVFMKKAVVELTLSGGEMLYQPDFALQLLLAAKEEGLQYLLRNDRISEKQSCLLK